MLAAISGRVVRTLWASDEVPPRQGEETGSWVGRVLGPLLYFTEGAPLSKKASQFGKKETLIQGTH